MLGSANDAGNECLCDRRGIKSVGCFLLEGVKFLRLSATGEGHHLSLPMALRELMPILSMQRSLWLATTLVLLYMLSSVNINMTKVMKLNAMFDGY